MGPKVSDEAFNWWKGRFDKMLADPKFAELRSQRDLLPFAMTGSELEQYVLQQTEAMRTLSQEFDLVKKYAPCLPARRIVHCPPFAAGCLAVCCG